MNQLFPLVTASPKTFWTIGIITLLMGVFLSFFLYLAYCSGHGSLILTDEQLQWRGDFYGRNISFSSLDVNKALKINLKQASPYQPRWRINGIGLPGYWSGWFKLKNGEKAFLWVTNPDEVLYIPTKENYSLLLSVQEPEKFLKALQEAINTARR